MAGDSGEEPSEKLQRKVKASAKVFFLNKDLVKVISVTRGADLIYLYNVCKQKEQVMLRSDFRKHRKRAYGMKYAGILLDRRPIQLNRYISWGLIDPPTGYGPGGVRRFHSKSYYSEDDLFKIREAMTSIHRGAPRKDGRITNSRVLTEKELRAKMGDELMLYTKTESGEFIPTWQETTY